MACDIQVYGADWCGLTVNLREYLTAGRFAYEFHDIDRDPAACALILALTDGRWRFPIVVVRERVLANPTCMELRRVLDANRIRAKAARRRPETSPPATRRVRSRRR
jgi:hypothetical protein